MKATLNTFKSFNTISILGIQSTGKSSLLNSMYNLDFAVSGGRTTKGINMRLLKSVDGEKAYILMDTEGQSSKKTIVMTFCIFFLENFKTTGNSGKL